MYELISQFTAEQLRKNFDEYTNARENLMKDSEAYVCNFGIGDTKEGSVIAFCTWTDFMPVIMPIVDYVNIVVPKTNEVSVYIIEENKLFEILGNKAVRKDSPVKHILIENLEDNEEIQKRVLESAKFLKTQAMDEKNPEKPMETARDIIDSRAFHYGFPTTKKFFIKLFLMSVEPKSDKEVALLFNQNQMYSSKVNEGEQIYNVLDKEVPMLTGSKDYELIDVKDGGYDFDEYGNKIPRLDLIIQIPYFNLHERNLPYSMLWKIV